MIKVIKVISNIECSRCERTEIPIMAVYNCVKEKNIPTCKKCGTYLSYVVNCIPAYDFIVHRTEKELNLLSKLLIRHQYFDSGNNAITIGQEDNREYKVN